MAATEAAGRSTTVAAAAEEAAVNVDTVAAAAEELGASVHEMASQGQSSAGLAQAAVAEVNETGQPEPSVFRGFRALPPGSWTKTGG